VDNTNTWTAKFGEPKVEKRRWRVVKKLKALSNRLGDIEIAKAQKEKAMEKAKEKAKKERKQAKEMKKAKEKVKKRKKEKVKNQGTSEAIS
jgi:hypothetical protein